MELTTVVNNQLRKKLWAQPPSLPLPEGDKARRIDGPRYDLSVVKQLATGKNIRPMTQRVVDDLEDLRWDVDDVAAVIQELTEAEYRCSEWAQVSGKMVVDADVYVVEYDHSTQRRRRLSDRYYLKFGFANESILLILVSCHEERI